MVNFFAVIRFFYEHFNIFFVYFLPQKNPFIILMKILPYLGKKILKIKINLNSLAQLIKKVKVLFNKSNFKSERNLESTQVSN